MRRKQDSFNILNSLGEALITTDSTGEITLMNASAESLTGLHEADVIGKPVETILHITESEAVAFRAGIYEEVLKYRTIEWNSDKPMFLLGKGKVIPVAGNAAIIADTAGKVEGIALLFREILTTVEEGKDSSVSENRSPVFSDSAPAPVTEEKLRALNTRYEALLAAIPEIIMEVGSNKVYCWGNQAGIEFFGNDVLGHEAAFYFEGK